MQIFLDEKKIDFQLEKEKTVNDVVKALNRWLLENNFIIQNLKIDNSSHDFTDSDSLKNISVETAEKIEINTISITEFKLAQLDAVQDFFNIVMNNIKTGDTENLFTVLNDYKNIKPLLKSNIDKIYDSSSEGFIETLIQNRNLTKDQEDKLETFCQNIIVIAESRKYEIIEPENELESLKNSFERLSEEIGNVSILLQTGKDKEAMDTVLSFVEFSKKLSRVLNALEIKHNMPIEGNLSEFNTVLTSLCKALENSDSVLVGDLLEYEIVPLIETLLTEIQ